MKKALPIGIDDFENYRMLTDIQGKHLHGAELLKHHFRVRQKGQ